jgi:glycosyltransferase involved in cell wall biosynthesis
MSESPSNTKLLLITTVPETFNFFRGQVSYMKQQGFDIYALSSSSEMLSQFGDQEQITVKAVNMPRRITPFKDLLAIVQIWQYLRQLRPHIVHASTPKGGLLGIVAAWLARSPVRIYHMRGLPLETARGYKRWLLWLSEKVSCSLAHQVICVSRSLREVAISEGLCPVNKIKVLLGGSSNGVDASDRFNPAHVNVNAAQEIRQAYGIPTDALVVGFVGRIVRDKGMEELVQAWEILRDEFPHLHLLLVGPFEPQDPISSNAEQTLKQDPRIHLTDRVSTLPPFYAAIDILTLPTYREGFPNTPLEAAAMQLPVVATRVPGCVDAVQDWVTGILVPPRDAVALADAIRIYARKPELRYQHGQAGRDRVLRDFRQEAIWEAFHQEYKRLLQEEGLSVPMPVVDLSETVCL